MKAAIYCRVSTEQQHADKQLADCRQFAKDRGFEIISEHLENLSGFKQLERLQYDKVKELARTGKIKAVIVWALDRWVRNRDTLLEDVTILGNYNCKLYSVKENWLDAINIDGALGKTIRDFLLGLIGSIAEMESERRSQRIKMAYKNRKGRWGRKNLPKPAINKVKELHANGMSMREISKNVRYTDKNNNMKNISIGAVHKILHEK